MIILETNDSLVKIEGEVDLDSLDRQAEEVRAILAEADRLAEGIAACEAEDEMDVESYHAWLDSLAPLDDELARRDLGDPGWGHLA